MQNNEFEIDQTLNIYYVVYLPVRAVFNCVQSKLTIALVLHYYAL